MDMTRGTCEHGMVWALADAEIYFVSPCADCEGRLGRLSDIARQRVVSTLRQMAQASWGQDIMTDISLLVPA